VDEDVFLGVIPVDETISRFYVKPLDCSGDFRGYHLLWFLRFDIASLLLVRLALRVIHDGNVVWMVTNLFPRLFPKMAADLVRGSGGNLPIIDTATHTTRTVQLMKSCSIRDLL